MYFSSLSFPLPKGFKLPVTGQYPQDIPQKSQEGKENSKGREGRSQEAHTVCLIPDT